MSKTIEEVKELKAKAQEDILNIINKLRKDSDCFVSHLSLQQDKIMTINSEVIVTTSINLELEI